ncbi:MAG: cytochrome c-type biogenesis CcmF C-terminal domain-containing protein, partial [Bacteroidota bacterium]
LYSTFLTRSGILGETSVHAFTDLGMSGQLLLYLLSFLILGIVLLVVNYRHLPKSQKEDALLSREFWMFIGALVLFLSAMQITFLTSAPVINKIFGTNLAPPTDPISTYHSWQIPLAIIIALIIAFGQFLRYKKTDARQFFRKLALSFFVSIAGTVLIAWGMRMTNAFYIALLFTTFFAMAANLDYLVRVVRGQIEKAGASIAHVGFALVLMGALISTSTSNVISSHQSPEENLAALDANINNREHILLRKDDTLSMGGYQVAYRGRERKGVNIYFQVDYYQEQAEQELEHAFTLKPVVQLNPRMGNAPEPDTRHFLGSDIYTHVTYALLGVDSTVKNVLDSVQISLSVGDTFATERGLLILERIDTADKGHYGLAPTDVAARATIKAIDSYDGSSHKIQPVFVIRQFRPATIIDQLGSMGLVVSFDFINPETEQAIFTIRYGDRLPGDFIVMKAIVFPYINVLWLGCVLLVIGTILAILHRIQLSRKA